MAIQNNLHTHSDVPILLCISRQSEETFLEISDFQGKIVKQTQNYFNDKALARFTIQGNVTGERGFFPRIAACSVHQHVSCIKYGADIDVQLTPIVTTSERGLYQGEPIPFSLSVELALDAYNLGTNTYTFHCDDLSITLTVCQPK